MQHLQEDRSIYSECALQLDNKSPVILGHVLLEMLLQQLDRLARNFADKGILQCKPKQSEAGTTASLHIKQAKVQTDVYWQTTPTSTNPSHCNFTADR